MGLDIASVIVGSRVADLFVSDLFRTLRGIGVQSE